MERKKGCRKDLFSCVESMSRLRFEVLLWIFAPSFSFNLYDNFPFYGIGGLRFRVLTLLESSAPQSLIPRPLQ